MVSRIGSAGGHANVARSFNGKPKAQEIIVIAVVRAGGLRSTTRPLVGQG
jgi:hypothetical protein